MEGLPDLIRSLTTDRSVFIDRLRLMAQHPHGNLSSIAVGHEHKMIMEFNDADRIIEPWTWRISGKDTEMTYHLVRKK
jgi:hypothetical protein